MLTEDEARKAWEPFISANTVQVQVPRESLNKFVKLVPEPYYHNPYREISRSVEDVQEQYNTPEDAEADGWKLRYRWKWAVDRDVVKQEWLKAGAPLEWTP